MFPKPNNKCVRSVSSVAKVDFQLKNHCLYKVYLCLRAVSSALFLYYIQSPGNFRSLPTTTMGFLKLEHIPVNECLQCFLATNTSPSFNLLNWCLYVITIQEWSTLSHPSKPEVTCLSHLGSSVMFVIIL